MKPLKLLLPTVALVCGTSFQARSQVYTSDDIMVQLQPSGNHDSTVCATTGILNYTIVISNSALDDTCSVVTSDGFLLTQYINTTGENPWMINTAVAIQQMNDLYLTNNYAVFFMQNTKIVTPHDTLYDIINTFQIPVPDPCSYSHAGGRVYIDANNDCVYNSGDEDLSGVGVTIESVLSSPSMSTAYASTQSLNGIYDLPMQESWFVSATAQIDPAYQFIFPGSACSVGTYTFSMLPQTNVDFPLQCTSDVDVQSWIGSNGFARPNIPFYLFPSVSNTGCDAASGTLKLVLPSDVVYDPLQSTNPATSVSGDTLIWNYANLTNLSSGGYWNSFVPEIHLTPTVAVNIGDTLCFTVIASASANDVNLANNTATICLPVVNSYDPNMKESMPKGEGPQGWISSGTEKLTYTIHFQNMGNAPAYNISVVDTLDADIIPSSLRILGTSHHMSPEWLSPNVVKFNFYNINLADHTSNEPASHGSVTFEIALGAGLQPGTTIENTAHIFFDFNPAIVTNTALNTIVDDLGMYEAAQAEMIVYPNPASGKVTVAGNGITAVSLTDLSGKTVLKRVELPNGELDISGFTDGMYLLQIETDRGTTVKKLEIRN